MKQLIWFSEIKWDYLVTRKQQILKRFPADVDILFIEPYARGKKQNWKPRQDGSITVITIPFLKIVPPSILATLLNRSMVRWLIGGLATCLVKMTILVLGFTHKDRVIALSSPFWGKIASRQNAALHFYDANDAHLDFPGTPDWLEDYLATFVRSADLCFAVSPEIKDDVEQLGGQNVVLLGNGVDYNHFSTPQDKPEVLKKIKKPILGYAGAMDWLDAELLKKICLAFPEYEIVMLGPEIRPGWFSDQEHFKGLKNLHYLGKIDYQVLPAYVQSFKVGLIPFVVDELTKPLNPNKLYEYSAANKPVVSMNYSSTIEGLSDTIFVGHTHAEFIEQISTAMAKHCSERSRDLASKNSWDNVAQTMYTEITTSLSSGH